MYRIAMEEVKKRGINIRFINIMTKKKKINKEQGHNDISQPDQEHFPEYPE